MSETIPPHSQPTMGQPNVVVFGPDANCTLSICPIEWTVYKYRPSLPANITFLIVFAIAMNLHIYLCIRWRTWWFTVFMVAGCASEIIGYAGRILLYNNPFTFVGFLIQIIFITGGPVFYTAAIYITLSTTIGHLAPEISRIKPVFFYWSFIASDIICITLQATGGALSTTSQGSSQAGVDLALAGLSLQVVVIVIFCCFFVDYVVRYFKKNPEVPVNRKLKQFFGYLSLATILILARCAYRCYELSQGYSHSTVITDEGLFIALEGVLILVAVFVLCLGHPGYVFGRQANAIAHHAGKNAQNTEDHRAEKA